MMLVTKDVEDSLTDSAMSRQLQDIVTTSVEDHWDIPI